MTGMNRSTSPWVILTGGHLTPASPMGTKSLFSRQAIRPLSKIRDDFHPVLNPIPDIHVYSIHSSSPPPLQVFNVVIPVLSYLNVVAPPMIWSLRAGKVLLARNALLLCELHFLSPSRM